MKGVCPICEKITELEVIREKNDFRIRGEEIEVDVEYLRCLECNGEFEDPKSKEDPLEKAYREYRNRYNMMQSEEILDLRKRYSLTQRELSRLMGCGGATLSRYENGALQDDSHDRFLKLLKNPNNMQRLIITNGDFLPTEKRNRLLNELSASLSETCSLPELFKEIYGKYEPDILSGFNHLHLDKLLESIKYFSLGGVLKTKLCKLLFYSDFKHFKDNAVSITGARYAHAHHGPVPDNYEYYFATLIHDEKSISIEELDYGEYVGEKFVAEISPDLKVFSESELAVIEYVKRYFSSFNASKMRDFSHKEKGYNETSNGELISYEHAESLQIGRSKMGKPRDYHKYHYKIGNKIVHGGITNDLERREQEHKQKWPSGHIKQVGRKTTEEGARNWEQEKGYT